MLGSASPATSGTPRPAPDGALILALVCQEGMGNCALNPPPLEPPWGPSFQAVSLVMAPLALSRVRAPAAENVGRGGGEIDVVLRRRSRRRKSRRRRRRRRW